ncbi:hypothetical protein [Vibrio coralliilyticus]|uniref:hypothetical protein n=1 Tax=Vibrio coralliilyticus TaxID=190893 RepID=UPI003B0077C7
MTQQIDRYAVFGNPISQSKSPFIHTLFARQTNQSLTYTAELAPVDGFVAAAETFLLKTEKDATSLCHSRKMLTDWLHV